MVHKTKGILDSNLSKQVPKYVYLTSHFPGPSQLVFW